MPCVHVARVERLPQPHERVGRRRRSRRRSGTRPRCAASSGARPAKSSSLISVRATPTTANCSGSWLRFASWVERGIELARTRGHRSRRTRRARPRAPPALLAGSRSSRRSSVAPADIIRGMDRPHRPPLRASRGGVGEAAVRPPQGRHRRRSPPRSPRDRLASTSAAVRVATPADLGVAGRRARRRARDARARPRRGPRGARASRPTSRRSRSARSRSAVAGPRRATCTSRSRDCRWRSRSSTGRLHPGAPLVDEDEARRATRATRFPATTSRAGSSRPGSPSRSRAVVDGAGFDVAGRSTADDRWIAGPGDPGPDAARLRRPGMRPARLRPEPEPPIGGSSASGSRGRATASGPRRSTPGS